MSHILLNYAFLCFEAFCGNSKWTSLLSQKSDNLINEHNVWKGANPKENLDLFKQLFLNKPVIEDKYYKKSFSPQSEPHTAKLCLYVVLKHFGGNS